MPRTRTPKQANSPVEVPESVETVMPRGRQISDEQREANQEKKKERFTVVVERRTDAALEQIEMLEQCANTSSYAFTAEQVSFMVGELRKAVDRLDARFQSVLAGGPRVKRAKRFDWNQATPTSTPAAAD